MLNWIGLHGKHAPIWVGNLDCPLLSVKIKVQKPPLHLFAPWLLLDEYFEGRPAARGELMRSIITHHLVSCCSRNLELLSSVLSSSVQVADRTTVRLMDNAENVLLLFLSSTRLWATWKLHSAHGLHADIRLNHAYICACGDATAADVYERTDSRIRCTGWAVADEEWTKMKSSRWPRRILNKTTEAHISHLDKGNLMALCRTHIFVTLRTLP